jgi:hypothetical protein
MLNAHFYMRSLIFTILAAFAFAHGVDAYTKTGATYTTDGSQSDVSAAIVNASTSDTFGILVGSFTFLSDWARHLTSVHIAITETGAIVSHTTVNNSPTAGTRGNAGEFSSDVIK